MSSKTAILFIIICILLIACSKKNNQKAENDSSEKNTTIDELTTSNSMTTEITTNSPHSTEDNNLNNTILKDNKLIINTEKIQLIAVRDGNTGKTVLEITDKDNIARIAEEISAMEFIEHEAIEADGWRYELIINSDEEIHIVISGNTQLYICTGDGSQIIHCKTAFDLLGYIENNLLNLNK